MRGAWSGGATPTALPPTATSVTRSRSGTVDDFLTSYGVAHVPEPSYPGSTSRAHWGLPDGTFGVRLIVLVPEDLTDLARALRLTYEPKQL